MKSIEILNEVKPKFPPKVQAIWYSCGTYIESINAVVAADELEFFIQELLYEVRESYNRANGSMTLMEVLLEEGYLNYERK